MATVTTTSHFQYDNLTHLPSYLYGFDQQNVECKLGYPLKISSFSSFYLKSFIRIEIRKMYQRNNKML